MATINEEYEQYVESKRDALTFLDQLKFALKQKSTRIQFQEKRYVDHIRNQRYTNTYTIARLFPNDDKITALKRELEKLDISEYIETDKDKHFPNRSDWRVFGRKYGDEEVFIKFRVELIPDAYVFIMSFHFSAVSFRTLVFPYK